VDAGRSFKTLSDYRFFDYSGIRQQSARFSIQGLFKETADSLGTGSRLYCRKNDKKQNLSHNTGKAGFPYTAENCGSYRRICESSFTVRQKMIGQKRTGKLSADWADPSPEYFGTSCSSSGRNDRVYDA